MNEYPQIYAKILETPWLITESSLRVILNIFDSRLNGIKLSNEEIQARLLAAHEGSNRTKAKSQGGVGVLQLYGPIFPKANMMTEMSGATSLEQFRQSFRSMVANDLIGTIVLDIDSPGGIHDLVPETAQEIHDATQIKPVVAVANTDAHSAAYFLGSQASEFYVTPSGSVGSIGVYTVHEDISRKEELEGRKTTLVHAGPHKIEGHPYGPLSQDARSFMQERVDEAYQDFVVAVARGRDTDTETVEQTFGGGRTVSARNALEVGMVDGIATLDTVIGELLEGGGAFGGSSGSLAAYNKTRTLRASYDADKEHSEPGTGVGGEPTPREAPETGDPAIEGGWRRDPPPIAYEETEESVMNRAQLETLATKLGVKFDAEMSDEELTIAVLEGSDEFVTPLVDATEKAQKARDFARDYPVQHAEFLELKRERTENAARNFASKFERIEGTNRGLSALLLDQVEEAHVRVSERTFNVEDLDNLVTALLGEEATLEYGESGSARAKEGAVVRAGATRQEIRQQTADEVARIMEEDGLDQRAALAVLSENNPDLVAAYLGS